MPAEDVQKLRIKLAGEGLTQNSTVGFELFENVSLSRSEFSERVTYLRALQGELNHTIEALAPVRRARVHLNLPQRPIFLDEKQNASAAIYVELETGSKLNENQIGGIVHLVANSVEGLQLSQVDVFDAAGSFHVNGGDLEEERKLGGDGEERSRLLTQQAQKLVDRVVGPGNALATVQIEIDLETRTTERELAEPGGEGKGTLLRREERIEDFKGTKPSPPQPRVVSPENPGEPQNPGGPNVETVQTEAGQELPTYVQKVAKEDFAVNRIRERSEHRAGKTSRLTASILVDNSVGLSPQQLADLAEGVKSAIGFDERRGDVLNLKALPFNRSHLREFNEKLAQEELAESQAQQSLIYLLVGFASLVVIGLVTRALMQKRKRRKEVWMDVSIDNAAGSRGNHKSRRLD